MEPPLWAPRRVNRPSKHSDGRLSIRELLLFGLLLFVFGCEGTWLDCFLWVGDDMNVYRGYTKPTRGVPHVITSCAGWRRYECVPRVHKATPSVDITTATEPSSHRRGTASYCEWILVRN